MATLPNTIAGLIQNSKYAKATELFLSETGTTIKVEFVEHEKHFDSDKESRDIYDVTIAKGSRSMKIRFGQSINASGEYVGHKNMCLNKFGKYRFTAMEIPKLFNHYDKKTYEVIRNKNFSVPTTYDVLECVTKHDPNSFEDFCSDFGYDIDSLSAKKTYKAVKKEWRDVSRVFSDSDIEAMREIV